MWATAVGGERSTQTRRTSRIQWAAVAAKRWPQNSCRSRCLLEVTKNGPCDLVHLKILLVNDR